MDLSVHTIAAKVLLLIRCGSMWDFQNGREPSFERRGRSFLNKYEPKNAVTLHFDVQWIPRTYSVTAYPASMNENPHLFLETLTWCMRNMFAIYLCRRALHSSTSMLGSMSSFWYLRLMCQSKNYCQDFVLSPRSRRWCSFKHCNLCRRLVLRMSCV